MPEFKLRGPKGTWPFLAAWGPDRAADAAFDVVFAWAVVRAAGSPSQAALLLSVVFLPQLVLMIPGGALGDRWGLAATAKWTLVARAVVMGLLALALMGDWSPIALLIAVGCLISVLDSFHIPAMTGLQSQLAGGDKTAQGELQAAVQGISRVAQIAGGFCVGSLLAVHAALPAGLCAGMLVLAALLLLRVGRLVPQKNDLGAEATLIGDVRDGWSVARSVPGMRTILWVLAASNALSAPAILLGIPLRAEEYDWPGWAYAVAYAMFSLGSVGGAVWVNQRRWRWRFPLRLGVLSILPACGGMALVAMAETPLPAAIGSLVCGISFAPSAPVLMGVIRAALPERHQGFGNAIMDVAIFCGIPLGHVIYGFVSGQWSSSSAGLAFALVLAGLTALAALTPQVRREEAQPTAS